MGRDDRNITSNIILPSPSCSANSSPHFSPPLPPRPSPPHQTTRQPSLPHWLPLFPIRPHLHSKADKHGRTTTSRRCIAELSHRRQRLFWSLFSGLLWCCDVPNVACFTPPYSTRRWCFTIRSYVRVGEKGKGACILTCYFPPPSFCWCKGNRAWHGMAWQSCPRARFLFLFCPCIILYGVSSFCV